MSDKLTAQKCCAGSFTWFLSMLSWLDFKQPTTPCTPITVVYHLELHVAITFLLRVWFFCQGLHVIFLDVQTIYSVYSGNVYIVKCYSNM
jgi:hypothetical protein